MDIGFSNRQLLIKIVKNVYNTQIAKLQLDNYKVYLNEYKIISFTFFFLFSGTKIVGATSMEDMIAKLKRPRRVMLLVKAGAAVDAFIDKLVPLMEQGDIIIDGGNSEYKDTNVSILAFST